LNGVIKQERRWLKLIVWSNRKNQTGRKDLAKCVLRKKGGKKKTK
jgi:hypothetical protein